MKALPYTRIVDVKLLTSLSHCSDVDSFTTVASMAPLLYMAAYDKIKQMYTRMLDNPELASFCAFDNLITDYEKLIPKMVEAASGFSQDKVVVLKELIENDYSLVNFLQTTNSVAYREYVEWKSKTG